MGLRDIAFFRGLDNKTSAFARLSGFTVKECVLACVLKDFDRNSFFVLNHQDRYVTYSNSEYLIFILVENNKNTLTEINKIINKNKHIKSCVIFLEQEKEKIKHKNHHYISVPDIIAGAVKRDIPARNLFLSFLKGLFDYPFP